MTGDMIMKTKYLVESCLLTHGLRSITDGEVIRAWDGVNATFAWIDEGENSDWLYGALHRISKKKNKT